MKLSLLEQETVLLYNQAESAAEVYTHDPKLMKKLEQLVAVADSYLDKKCGSLYKDDLRVHIGIMWALWESFNGAKPDTLGVDERILEELVIELLGV